MTEPTPGDDDTHTSTPRFRVNVLGPLQILDAAGSEIEVTSSTLRLLLGYLALHYDQSISRGTLAAKLWPRSPATVARRNLRQYLYRARSTLNLDADDGVLVITGQHVRLDANAGSLELDLKTFNTLTTDANASLQVLEAAVELYRDDLLADLDAPWLTLEREQINVRIVELLTRLVDEHTAAGNFESALNYARRLVEIDPYRDDAYKRLMTLLYHAGHRTRALGVYQDYAARLKADLNAEPMMELKRLYDSIRRGEDMPSLTIMPPVSATPEVDDAIPLQDETLSCTFVGRDSEYNVLCEALQTIHQGRGGYLMVRGEAGMGKSRLLLEALSHCAPDSLVLHVRGYEFDSVTLRPIRDAVRSALKQVDWRDWAGETWFQSVVQLVPEIWAELPGVTPNAPLPTTLEDIYQIWHDLAHLLVRIAERQPLVLALDDMHWSDKVTLQFLLMLQHWVEHAPIGVFICYQPGEGSLPAYENLMRRLEYLSRVVELRPLEAADVERLARYLLSPVEVDQVHMRQLIDKTEGNPFFVIEYAHVLRERHPLAANSWVDVPETVQRLVDERLDRLPQVGQRVLWTAAVLGRPFPLDLIASIEARPLGEIVEVIDMCMSRGLLVETESGYDFSHNIIREVSYERLSRARRAYLHRLVATALEQGDLPGEVDDRELAYHYAQSDQPEKAIHHTINACRVALRLRDFESARRMGVHTIQQMNRLRSDSLSAQERVDLELHLALAYAYTHDFQRALGLLQGVESLARSMEDMPRLAAVCRALAHVHWQDGRPEESQRYARLVNDLAGDEAVLRRASLRMLGRSAIVLGSYDEAMVQLRRYMTEAQEDSLTQQAIVHGYMGVAQARVGNWDAALKSAEDGVALATHSDNAAAVTAAKMQVTFILSERGRWQAALDVAESLLPGQTVDLNAVTFMLVALVGRARAQLGRGGHDQLNRALAWAREADYRILSHVPLLWLAESHLLANAPLQALKVAQSAMDASMAKGDRWATAVAMRLKARANWATDSPDWQVIEADLVKSALLLRRIRARPDLARTYLLQRRLYDRAGRSAWAIDCHYRAVGLFEELGMTEELDMARGHPDAGKPKPVISRQVELVGPYWQPVLPFSGP